MAKNKDSRISTLTTRTEHTTTMYGRAIHGWAYVALAFWSLMLIVFTIVRLAYTFGPRGGDRFLNNGRAFYGECRGSALNLLKRYPVLGLC